MKKYICLLANFSHEMFVKAELSTEQKLGLVFPLKQFLSIVTKDTGRKSTQVSPYDPAVVGAGVEGVSFNSWRTLYIHPTSLVTTVKERTWDSLGSVWTRHLPPHWGFVVLKSNSAQRQCSETSEPCPLSLPCLLLSGSCLNLVLLDWSKCVLLS